MAAERAKLVQATDKDEKKRDTSNLFKIDDHGFGVFAIAAVLGTLVGMIKVPLSSAGLSGTTFALTTTPPPTQPLTQLAQFLTRS